MLRDKLLGSLALLRRKDVIDSTNLLTTLFPILVSTPSKTFRTLLFQKILSDLRNSNSKATNHPLNRTIQTVLYNLVTSDRASPKGVWAVKLTRELWKKRIWTDAKTVDVMREACLSDSEKVVVGGVGFFLGGDGDVEEADDESSDEEAPDMKKILHQQKIKKKTKKQYKAYGKAVDKVKKAERKKNQTPHAPNFSALHLLNDAQGFAESLFSKHLQNSKSKLALDSKLLIFRLTSRLIGLHRLTVIPFYSWMTKYLTPRQESVTSFLASLAQATHSQVPPDAIEPLILKIASEFVSEASAAEVAAVGLNAIREICVRQDLAMSDALLQDLVQYRKSKSKGVMMAARGLLSLYRDRRPDLLAKKDRGKDATMGLRSGELKLRNFGEEEEGGIEGIELLEAWKAEERKRKRVEQGLSEDSDTQDGEGGLADDEGAFNSSDWDVASSDSNDSGGWINVSDSEDDQPVTKRQKKDENSAETDDQDKENEEGETRKPSNLATTSILTPADFAKLQELRMAVNVDKAMSKRSKRQQEEARARHADEALTAEQLELPTKLRKSTKEERIALAREGKPDREEHKSTQAIRKAKKEAAGKSTTNKEKAKKKNLMMTIGKARAKQKRSLVQTRKVLRGHIERSKRGGRRANGA